MTYLITGICGGAAHYIACKLLENGMDVVGMDLPTIHTKLVAKQLENIAKINKKKLKIYWMDFCNNADLEKLFKENKLSGIAHIAFIIPPYTELNAEHARNVNIGGTKQIIELAERYAQAVPFVFTSTTAVYGPQAKVDDIVGVDHPLQATDAYTEQKIQCEKMLENSSLDWRILRCSAMMNPTYRPSKAAVQLGLTINLSTPIEPVHVMDVATAVYHALILSAAAKKAFIVSGGVRTQTIYSDYIFKIMSGMMGNINHADIPWYLFSSKEPYYLHWYDSAPSQAILQYQSLTLDDYVEDASKQLRWWEKIGMKLVGKRFAIKKYFAL